jgi:hypothetical protein
MRARRVNTTTVRHAAAVAAILAALAAGNAGADTTWIEAESVRKGGGVTGTITSPLQIKDSASASNGGFVEVQRGNNSTGAMPTRGKVCYTVGITAPGDHRVWARVQAATTADDSFWVQVDGGAPVHWPLSLGSAWHWSHVHKSGVTTPSVFTLAAGDHELCFGYREDGARLDTLVVTDDPTFDPTVVLAGPPAGPRAAEALGGPGNVLVSWTTALGAQSYRVERRTGWGDGMGNFPPFVPIATLPADTFAFTDTPPAPDGLCYQVIAVNAAGESEPLEPFPCADARPMGLVAEAEYYSLTAPMRVGLDFDAHSIVEVKPGLNSLAAPPSSGWARLDFRLAGAQTLKVWGAVVAQNTNDDSFWVRMDFGPWVKWNDWKITHTNFCEWEDVHNSDTGGKAVHYSLGPGSHTLEFAYREDGAQLDKVFITTELGTIPPGGCFD